MKFARIRYQKTRWLAQVHDDHFDLLVRFGTDLSDSGGDWIESCQRKILAGDAWEVIQRVPFSEPDWNLLAPVTNPGKIVCVGRNYADHAAEMGSTVADIPVIFGKFPNSIADPDETIRLPKISQSVDYEAELVVVIGRTARDVSRESARDFVFGYCCGNDVSARDWQKGRPGGQWLLGKSFDGFAPIGPWIVAKDALDPSNLEISLSLNGEVMQADNTSNLIFDVDYLISHLSQFFTLHPGDLLFTGTPAGVGAGRTPPVFLKDGDQTTVEISGIGKLCSQFATEVSDS